MKMLLQMILSLAAGAAFATDIYVARESAQASDEPCEGRGTRALPYKTIQAAVDAAPDGANIWVGRGVYADTPTTSDSVLTRVVIGKSLKLFSGVEHTGGVVGCVEYKRLCTGRDSCLKLFGAYLVAVFLSALNKNRCSANKFDHLGI